jgi:hypothetical protein
VATLCALKRLKDRKQYGMTPSGYVEAMNAKTWHTILPPEYNFILFFSLPFYPVRRKTYYYHGHLALALRGTAYQLHDPHMLKSSFMVSKMPLDDWLFRDGPWFDDDPASTSYRHVHLYERAETKRTMVFYTALRGMPEAKLDACSQFLETIEQRYQQGDLVFAKYHDNCVSLINPLYYREGWLRCLPFDIIPAVIYRRICRAWKRLHLPFVAGRVNDTITQDYRLHRFCWGPWPLYPEEYMLRWIDRQNHEQKSRYPAPVV